MQIRRDPFERLFGQPPMSGDLAAVDRQQRRAARQVEFENIFARGRLGFAGPIIIERTDTGIGPHDVGRRYRLGEIGAYRFAQIGDFFRRCFHLRRIALVVVVGGADQSEVILIGNDENDAPVAVLEHVSFVFISNRQPNGAMRRYRHPSRRRR